ncbi:MAG: NADP-dependent phosphogluconate dehydrogenase, partial [Acidobacteriota bacterium]
LELGVPVPTLTAAVEARNISAMKARRVRASHVLAGPEPLVGVDVEALVADMEQALYAAKVCSYAQGFSLLAEADRRSEFGLELGLAAKVWRAGCIIRAAFLDDITASFRRDPALDNLLLAREFTGMVESRIPALRRVVGLAAASGIPVPALGASLSYFDAYRSARLPANLIQAQRDCFGAHTFRRTDREGIFHADWTKPAK